MNKILDRDTVTKEYFATYTPLVKQFCENRDVREIAKEYPFNEHNCAPAPILPIIGNGYYTAPIRVAIYGMETLKWHDLSKFIEKFQSGSLPKVKSYTDGIEGVVNPNHKKSRFLNNYALPWHEKNNFWGYVYSTLAGIYGVKENDIKERPDLLRSFIWGNVNAYERYDQTPHDVGMKKDDWQKVFKASECFNSAQLIIPYTCPHILVVFYGKDTKNENWFKEWLAGEDKTLVEPIPIPWEKFPKYEYLTNKNLMKMLTDNIHCYKYSGTYVLHTLHPGNMWRGRKGSKAENWKAAINFAIREMTNNFSFYFNN